MIHHGGKLLNAIAQYGGNQETWVDLSTGVSPFTYPVPAIPAQVWNRLPQEHDGLEAVAQRYYGASIQPLAIAGSQAAIMLLPATLTDALGRCGRVCLPAVGYKEHQHAWQSFQAYGQRWSVEFYHQFPTPEQIAASDVVVVINPNNPTGDVCSARQLQQLQASLSQRGGYLVVDEAFMDCMPQHSLLSQAEHTDSLIVLRSIGKFFGLAGARAGFVFCCSSIMQGLKEQLGPWTVTGPTRWVVTQALQDTDWQQQTRSRICESMRRLCSLLRQYFDAPLASTDLFVTLPTRNLPTCNLPTRNAPWLHQQLCQQQVFTRLCDEGDAIRFGLPHTEQEWVQLQQALSVITTTQAEVSHAE